MRYESMNNDLFRKGLVYAIVVLFIGVSIIPLTGSNVVEKSSMPTFDEIEDTSGCDCELGCELEIELIFGGYGITMIIKNIGDSNCTNVKWSITFNGGIILLGRDTSGTIICIPPGENVTVRSRWIIGFGRTTITGSVECAEGSSVTKEQEAFVLLFFIKII